MPQIISNTLRVLGLVCLICSGSFNLHAGADDSWAAIEVLDSGPQEQPATRDEASRFARQHFANHRAAIESFLVGYPEDPRAFDARIRLAGILAVEGKMDQKPALVRQALESLIALEKSQGVPSAKLADAAFRRISLQMQMLEGRQSEQRELVVTAARNFANRFPSDKRGPRLLVEAATICTPVPETMRALLTRAQALTTEPELLARISDDVGRLELLGKPLDLEIPVMQGKTIDLMSLRGRVVALVFWSAESPHSVLWLRGFQDQLRKIPKSDAVFIGISLDENRDELVNMMESFGITWPTYFNAKGWESDLVRSLGINAIPTLWLVDKRGVLRSINARDDFETTLRLLQRER
jgi:peroxiredoxin